MREIKKYRRKAKPEIDKGLKVKIKPDSKYGVVFFEGQRITKDEFKSVSSEIKKHRNYNHLITEKIK